MPDQRSRNRPAGRRPTTGPDTTSSGGATIRYPIPSLSARAWAAVSTTNVRLNPGLIFDRFAPDWSGQATLKKDGLEAALRAAKRVDGSLLQAWNARWEACAQVVQAEPFPLKTDWRFIAGLGRKGALEVGFTFHRYGFPILPGSSVKGVTRARALITIAERVNDPNLSLGQTGREVEPRRRKKTARAQSYTRNGAKESGRRSPENWPMTSAVSLAPRQRPGELSFSMPSP